MPCIGAYPGLHYGNRGKIGAAAAEALTRTGPARTLAAEADADIEGSRSCSS
jgi:hypothetical protein